MDAVAEDVAVAELLDEEVPVAVEVPVDVMDDVDEPVLVAVLQGEMEASKMIVWWATWHSVYDYRGELRHGDESSKELRSRTQWRCWRMLQSPWMWQIPWT